MNREEMARLKDRAIVAAFATHDLKELSDVLDALLTRIEHLQGPVTSDGPKVDVTEAARPAPQPNVYHWHVDTTTQPPTVRRILEPEQEPPT